MKVCKYVEQNRKHYIRDNLSSNWNLIEETNQKNELLLDRIEGYGWLVPQRIKCYS